MSQPNYPCSVFGGAGYLTRATSASLQTLGAAGSFLCRFRVSGFDTNQNLITHNSTGLDICYLTKSATLAANFAGAGWRTVSTTILPGVWYDALVMWQYPGNQIIYLCPAGGADTSRTDATANAGDWATGNMSLGQYQRGSLRDVMLLARVITPTEWAAYKAGVKPAGAVADWPLYPDWLDDSGNANTLTSGGIAPTFRPIAAPTPKPNYPCSVFGGASYLEDATGSADFLMATSDFSLACWYYEDRRGEIRYLFGRRATLGYWLYESANGDILAYINTGTTVGTTGMLQARGWHHVAATYDRDGNVTIYIDGTASGTPSDISGQSNLTDTTSKLTFAARSGGTIAKPLMLRDARIYNRVLTPTEVTALAAGAGPVDFVERWPLYPNWEGDNGHDLTASGVSPTFNPKAVP